MLMASSTTHPHGLKVAVIALILISFLTSLLPFKSAGSEVSSYSESLQQRKKMVLGSKPPRCVNKCLNCRPCMATLVIPPRQRRLWETPLMEKTITTISFHGNADVGTNSFNLDHHSDDNPTKKLVHSSLPQL
ncbi:hypothetical protein CK203_040656 [Vitis vinifera]|uniref:Uncharacterized protein n=1 Tax=Vitis vinifera TaxID=29760 RepID=A0A438HIY3_VITVI|nr:hypothetical protein CK203_040656 [Vitis vinifera]